MSDDSQKGFIKCGDKYWRKRGLGTTPSRMRAHVYTRAEFSELHQIYSPHVKFEPLSATNSPTQRTDTNGK